MNAPLPAEKLSRRAQRLRSLLKKADDHYRQGHRRRAIWYYRKALKLSPDHVTALVNLGLIYSMSRGKHATARELLRRAREIEPDNPTVLFNLATLTAQAGDAAEAMALLEQVEQREPDYADLHYNKAYLFAQDERWEAARREIERELNNNPGNLNALIMQKAIEHRLKNDASESSEPSR